MGHRTKEYRQIQAACLGILCSVLEVTFEANPVVRVSDGTVWKMRKENAFAKAHTESKAVQRRSMFALASEGFLNKNFHKANSGLNTTNIFVIRIFQSMAP